jgi:hypothetical protein
MVAHTIGVFMPRPESLPNKVSRLLLVEEKQFDPLRLKRPPRFDTLCNVVRKPMQVVPEMDNPPWKRRQERSRYFFLGFAGFLY